MGDTSIVARRLPDGDVQYGWSGNQGYCWNTGRRLYDWYNEPEKVDKLFELGQTGQVGKPGCENCKKTECEYSHNLTKKPYWYGISERQIFDKIPFVDYGYFYDIDNRWYYVNPRIFIIKIPLEYVIDYLIKNDTRFEFDYLNNISHNLMQYILEDYYNEDEQFRIFFEENFDISAGELLEELLEEEYPLECLRTKYSDFCKYFDRWIVVDKCDDTYKFKIRKKQISHIETIEW